MPAHRSAVVAGNIVEVRPLLGEAESAGTQFTCFNSTKAQILTQKLAANALTEQGIAWYRRAASTKVQIKTSTKAQILTQKLAANALTEQGIAWYLRAASQSHADAW